jgi:hypothetical protein
MLLLAVQDIASHMKSNGFIPPPPPPEDAKKPKQKKPSDLQSILDQFLRCDLSYQDPRPVVNNKTGEPIISQKTGLPRLPKETEFPAAHPCLELVQLIAKLSNPTRELPHHLLCTADSSQ